MMNERARTLITFLAADPGDLFSRYALALEYRKMGLWEECVRELRNVTERDPTYLGAYYQLGSLLAEHGQYKDAEAVYRQGIMQSHQAGDAHSEKELREALAMMELESE